MEWPGTRVIIVPLQHDERRRVGVLSILKNLHITSLCIIRVDNCTIPITEALSKHIEIVTVKMHWVSAELTVVPENNTNAAVSADVDDVPFFLKCQIAGLCFEEHWVIVIATEAAVIHEPEETCSV